MLSFTSISNVDLLSKAVEILRNVTEGKSGGPNRKEIYSVDLCSSDASDGKKLLHVQNQLLTIYSSCTYYKPESDTAYTQIYIAEGCDSILHIGVVRKHKANFHVRNYAVLGGSQQLDQLVAL